MNKLRFLKIKLKSLAEESRIIRKEEGRSRGDLRTELHEHRVRVVRRAARLTHLAYAMARGKARVTVEAAPWSALQCISAAKEIAQMISKYGPEPAKPEAVIEWLKI